jgi:hypothetical protein
MKCTGCWNKIQGLKSRFTSYIDFDDFTTDKCVEIVQENLAAQQPVSFTIGSKKAVAALRDGFAELKSRPGWANGRDAEEMCNKIVCARDLRLSISDNRVKEICTTDVETAVKEFLEARPEKKVVIDDPVAMATFAVNEMLHRGVSVAMSKAQNTVMFAEDVTDDEEKRETTEEMDRMLAEVEDRLREEQDEAHEQAIAEELRRLEELRLQVEQAKVEERRKLLERERKRQALMQKLARIGVCPAGYVWRRERSGFRCGGGHFVTLAQLDLTADDAKELGM